MSSRTQINRAAGSLAALALLTGSLASALAGQVRVQDIAKLQGQRTNKLFGFGLVVGLDGTGDGPKYPSTLRALMSLHKNYHQPVLDIQEMKANTSVAIVAVEVTVPEFGAREGQTLDVILSVLGAAKSLRGGQLLTTPLQDATLSMPDIFALAGGRVELPDPANLKRGIIRGGATLEADFFYNFIQDSSISLVLDDPQAGFPLAQVVARAINHELAAPGADFSAKPDPAQRELAEVLGPKSVRVRVPTYELSHPAGFISRVLQTALFDLPQLPARVVIDRTSKTISYTGAVTISPTVLQLPGTGTVSIGGAQKDSPSNLVGLDSTNSAGVEFKELLNTLGQLQLSPQQTVDAIESLHRAGTLHAQLVYQEK